ncbi:unnamed protein product [Polarella glacialis]|uniref:Phospholipid/glycerol acyltransferase domain-containing protein n=1 Tax=Polarella glacialis TaxID=89957 RepID=A0A813KNM1_POLGL|nr:unnamed protein product [Polarella glacialis]CAE8711529.1 unnamed protein product [Polarella glacialis]
MPASDASLRQTGPVLIGQRASTSTEAESEASTDCDPTKTPKTTKETSLTANAELTPSGSGKPGFRPLRVPLFLCFLLYIQATSAICLVLLILGISVSPGLVTAHYLFLLQTSFSHTPTSRPVIDDTSQPVIFLANHRSWGDFWVDAALLGGPSFISRMLVAVSIPCSAGWGYLRGWLWFFHRGAKYKGGTVNWMMAFWRACHEDCPGKGVVMYPEGTRSLLPQGLPLKPGGLAAAFKLSWPVQIVITTNKEFVMAEKSLGIGFGIRCVTSVSEPLWPKDFASFEDFIEAVEALWQQTWRDACGHVSVPRSSALLPGAKQRPTSLFIRGNFRVQAVRLVVGLSLFYYGFPSQGGSQTSSVERLPLRAQHFGHR